MAYNDSFDFESNISNAPGEEWGNYDTSMSEDEMFAANQTPDYNWNPNYDSSNIPFGGVSDFGQGSMFDFSGTGQMPQGTFDLGTGGGVGVMPDTLDRADMGGGWDTSGVQQTLANLFNSKGMEYGLKGLAALMEGRQNKKYAGDVRSNVQQMQQGLDPFGSQRPFYQQQLQQTVQNPYSAPIVRDQVAQIAKAQAIKDAAAGRRSNSATSSPAMLAAQAQIAQQYMNSLMQPAGAGIGPQQVSGGLSALNQASQANTQGYASPIMNALGNTQQDQIIEAIKALAAKNSGGG